MRVLAPLVHSCRPGRYKLKLPAYLSASKSRHIPQTLKMVFMTHLTINRHIHHNLCNPLAINPIHLCMQQAHQEWKKNTRHPGTQALNHYLTPTSSLKGILSLRYWNKMIVQAGTPTSKQYFQYIEHINQNIQHNLPNPISLYLLPTPRKAHTII